MPLLSYCKVRLVNSVKQLKYVVKDISLKLTLLLNIKKKINNFKIKLKLYRKLPKIKIQRLKSRKTADSLTKRS